jgi:hypothetical protein
MLFKKQKFEDNLNKRVSSFFLVHCKNASVVLTDLTSRRMVEGKVTVDGVLGGQPDSVVSRYLCEQLPEKGMNCIF